jgi:DNA transformation protein
MFGLIAPDTLYFKVDHDNRPAFEAEGSEPFSYEGKGKPIQLPYWRVPERLFDEPEEMLEWARAAFAAARRASAAKAKTRQRVIR